MPLYEYRCKQCGHVFEKIQSFSAPEEKVCPVCGGEVERLISAPAIQFKGSGWYVNDYAAKPKSGSGKSSGSSSDSSSGSGDSGKSGDSGSGSSDKPAAASGGSGGSSAPSPSTSSSTKSE